ncbi:DNA polymerase III subunit gamma/tau [Candidatus Berkelbacteria bacterium]|nr:DNA polymerase III subunit gamma/tau [Candidatus Berkelbacteria bacterium]
MSLYRKYRPKKFSEVIGQDHVKKTLVNAIKFDEVVHGYLFSGSRGIGKTSIARILAMALNCEARSEEVEPCGECPSCKAIVSGSDLSVVEIDAASNRGIDEIRALREAIAIAPPVGKKKVYIIDEVHMLTKEAFNALLKTLEEPPAHAIFILATTEVDRIPDTIISRIQHFEFKRATIDQLKTQLTDIAQKEKLELEPTALDLIITQANGGFRDSLTILNQLQSLGETTISVKVVETNLGLVSATELTAIIDASLDRQADQLKERFESLNAAGYKPSGIIDSLINIFRFGLWQLHGVALPEGQPESVEKTVKKLAQQSSSYVEAKILKLLQAKQQLRWSPLPMLPIELAMLPEVGQQGSGGSEQNTESRIKNRESQKASLGVPGENNQTSSLNRKSGATIDIEDLKVDAKPETATVSSRPSERMERSLDSDLISTRDDNKKPKAQNTKHEISETSPSTGSPPNGKAASPSSRDNQEVNHQSPITNQELTQAWPEIIAEIRLENASLGALLRSCLLVGAANNELVIQVPFSFYGDRIADTKNEAIINAKVKAKLGISGKIRCQLAQNQAPTPPPPPPPMIKDQSANQAVADESGQKESVLEAAKEIFGVRAE